MKSVQIAVSALIWLVILGAILLLVLWWTVNKYFFLPKPPLLLSRDKREQINFRTSDYLTPLNIESLEKSSDLYFKYNDKFVDRVEGNFNNFKPGNFLLMTVNNEKRIFTVNDDTKFVCQPSGFLNLSTSSEDLYEANKVFIDDKTQKNYGIPWGFEISKGTVAHRVSDGSLAHVYYMTSPNPILNLPKVIYVWFKNCK